MVIERNEMVREIQLNEVLPVKMAFCNSSLRLWIYNYAQELMCVGYSQLFSVTSQVSFEWRVTLSGPVQNMQLVPDHQSQCLFLILSRCVYIVSD